MKYLIPVFLLAVVSYGDSLEVSDSMITCRYTSQTSPYETYYFYFTAPSAGDYIAVLQSENRTDNYLAYHATDSTFQTYAIQARDITVQYFLKFSASAEGERHFFHITRPWIGVPGGGFGFFVRPSVEISIGYSGNGGSFVSDTAISFPSGVEFTLSWNPPAGKKFIGWHPRSGAMTVKDSSAIRSAFEATESGELEALLSDVLITVVTQGTDTFTFADNSYNGTPETGVILRFDPPDTGRYALYPWKSFSYRIANSLDSVLVTPHYGATVNYQIYFTVTSVDIPVYFKILDSQFSVTIGKPELQLIIDTTYATSITFPYTGEQTTDNAFLPCCPKPIQLNVNRDYRLDSIQLTNGEQKELLSFNSTRLVTITETGTIKAFVSMRPILPLTAEWKIYDTYISRYDNEALVSSFTPSTSDSFTVHSLYQGEEYGFIIAAPDVYTTWTVTNSEGYSPLAYTFFGQADSTCYFRIRTGCIKRDTLVALIVVKQGDTIPAAPDLTGKTPVVRQLQPGKRRWSALVSSSGIIVDFSLERPEHITFELIGPDGRKIFTYNTGPFAPGTHRYLIPHSRVVPGVYLLRMNGTGNTQVRRIALVR